MVARLKCRWVIVRQVYVVLRMNPVANRMLQGKWKPSDVDEIIADNKHHFCMYLFLRETFAVSDINFLRNPASCKAQLFVTPTHGIASQHASDRLIQLYRQYGGFASIEDLGQLSSRACRILGENPNSKRGDQFLSDLYFAVARYCDGENLTRVCRPSDIAPIPMVAESYCIQSYGSHSTGILHPKIEENCMNNRIKKNRQDLSPESGQGMLEYILIVVFVVIAGIGMWRQFGQKVQLMLSGADSALGTAVDDMCADMAKDGTQIEGCEQ